MQARVDSELNMFAPQIAQQHRIAVVLNRNAKRVGKKVQAQVEAALPEGADLFLTESVEQARFIIRRIVDSGYQTLVTGGGDGTIVGTIDEALTHRDARGYAQCPSFAVLKLGTGNAIADFLGASDYREDLKQLPNAPVRWMDIMKVNGRRTTFAGFGWDAHILNHYNRLREVSEQYGPMASVFKTVAGYLVAGLAISVPEFIIRKPAWNVRVYNGEGIGLQLDQDGEVIRRIAPGDLAYEGSVNMGCMGTTPYYGYRIKMMPFAAQKSGLLHLRLISMSPQQAVINLPSIWQGTVKGPGLHDFQLSGCRIEFEDEAPFQVAGDAEGLVESLNVQLDHPIRCATFG